MANKDPLTQAQFSDLMRASYDERINYDRNPSFLGGIPSKENEGHTNSKTNASSKDVNLLRLAVALSAFNAKQKNLSKAIPLGERIRQHAEIIDHAEKMGSAIGQLSLRQDRRSDSEKQMEKDNPFYFFTRQRNIAMEAPLTESQFDNVYLNPTLRVLGLLIDTKESRQLNDPLQLGISIKGLKNLENSLYSRLSRDATLKVDDALVTFVEKNFYANGLAKIHAPLFLRLHETSQSEVVPNIRALLTTTNTDFPAMHALSQNTVNDTVNLENLGLLQEKEVQAMIDETIKSYLYAEHLPNVLMSLMNEMPLLSEDVLKTYAKLFVDGVAMFAPAQQTLAVTRLITGLGPVSDPDAAVEGRTNQYKEMIDDVYKSVGDIMMPNVDIIERTLLRTFVESELAQRNILIGHLFSDFGR